MRRSGPAAAAIAAAILVWTVAALPAAADVYVKKDRDGVLHFTNVRKPGYRLWMKSPSSSGRRGRGPSRAAARRSYGPIVEDAARRYHIPPSLVHAVILVESNYNPSAVSRKGAEGLMQLMPGTAMGLGVTDSFDPHQNIHGGTRYLRLLANRFHGDLVLTVAAYNAGPSAVEKYLGIPPYAETRRYVRAVLRHYYRLKSAER